MQGEGREMSTDETPQQRLARLVKARRLELRLSVRAAAKAAGVDRNTWSSLEDGTRVLQDRNYDKVETASQWPPGEILRILATAESPEDADARRAVEMSWAEIAVLVADAVAAGGPHRAGTQLEQIVALRAKARQGT